jgi:predicted enzyme related to lactoylglutathione lyase
MTDGRRLVAVILSVSDLDRSTTLYREVFGVDLHPGDNGGDDPWIGGQHAEVSWTQGAYLHFALYPAKDRPTTGVQISLSVDDIESSHDRAVRAGAKVLHEPRKEPWGRSARYEDFDGNVVELTQPLVPLSPRPQSIRREALMEGVHQWQADPGLTEELAELFPDTTDDLPFI